MNILKSEFSEKNNVVEVSVSTHDQEDDCGMAGRQICSQYYLSVETHGLC